MNIFILHKNPVIAAEHQADKHVVKMVLERTQLLSGAFHKDLAPYRHTHLNHPCSIWTRSSSANWQWLLAHAYALSDEYTFRYGKIHACVEKLDFMKQNISKLDLSDVGLTPFAQAMPNKYLNENAVLAYRRYYLGEKSVIAKWNKARTAPGWYISGDINLDK